MEQHGNQKAPSSLLPGVLDHLGLKHTSPALATPAESPLTLLTDADWRVRAKAISAAGEDPTLLPFESLLSALHDEDVSVRSASVHALGSRGQVALPYITEALHDSEWLVREAAVLALGTLGEQASMEKLLASLDDENEFVREAAQLMLEHNEYFRFDDPDDFADDGIVISNLEPFAYSSNPRQRFTFMKPRRLAAAVLTGLVVIGLIASWLLLLPAIRSSRSAHNGLTPRPGTVLFRDHYQGGVFFPQWTPDGKHLAFVDDYGHMYIWDASTKKLNRTFTLPFHPDPNPLGVWGWTSDGNHIVSYDSNSSTIQVWDAITGQIVYSSTTTQNYVWADDGKSIAIIDQSNIIHVLDMDTVQEQYTLSSEHFKKLCTISWSPDRQRIATTSLDGIVEIWDAASGKKLSSFSDPGIASQRANTITALIATWSPDSSRLLIQRVESNNAYKTLQIWDASSGRKLQSFSAHSSIPFLVRWFSDGKRILSASDHEILIWEAATGHILLRMLWNGPQSLNMPVLSPDERLLAISDEGPTIQLWDIAARQKIFTYRGHSASVISATTTLTWSPDSSLISSADTDGNILVWQAATGKLIFKYKLNLFLPSQFIPTHLAFLVWSPDGTMLAIASDEGTIAVVQGP